MLCLPPTGAEWAQGSERRACIHLGECCKLPLMHTDAAHRLISLTKAVQLFAVSKYCKNFTFPLPLLSFFIRLDKSLSSCIFSSLIPHPIILTHTITISL